MSSDSVVSGFSRTCEVRLKVGHYSLRNATTGSTRIARHAGAATAIAAVVTSTRGTAANVIGSSGCTPNRNVEIDRLSAAAAPSPMTVPMTTRRPALESDEPEHAAGAGAKRNPHAEFARALLNRVGQHAEHTDHREDERQQRERCDEHCAETRARCRLRPDLVECSDTCDRTFAVHTPQRCTHRCHDGARRTTLWRHRERRLIPGVLIDGHVDLWRRHHFVWSLFDLACDTDNLSRGRRLSPKRQHLYDESHPDRVAVAEVAPDEGFADDADRCAVRAVLIGEGAASGHRDVQRLEIAWAHHVIRGERGSLPETACHRPQ